MYSTANLWFPIYGTVTQWTPPGVPNIHNLTCFMGHVAKSKRQNCWEKHPYLMTAEKSMGTFRMGPGLSAFVPSVWTDNLSLSVVFFDVYIRWPNMKQETNNNRNQTLWFCIGMHGAFFHDIHPPTLSELFEWQTGTSLICFQCISK